MAWLALILFGALLVGMHWDALTADITARVFTGDNMLILALLYPLLKAFHEFGHALVVKALGGSCREMGLMFLVFIPVPYVDASSSATSQSTIGRSPPAGTKSVAKASRTQSAGVPSTW